MTSPKTPSPPPPVPDQKPLRQGREERAIETKAHLTRTALELFARHGYVATSTKQVAKAAGVSEGLIFHHFATKLDLLMSVASQHEVLAARIRTLLAEGTAQPAPEVIRSITRNFVQMLSPARVETQLFRVLVSESMTTPELGELFRRVGAGAVQAIADYLAEHVRSGELRADLHTEAAAGSLLGSLFWFFIMHQHLSAEDWQAQALEFAECTAEQWLRGALAHPTSLNPRPAGGPS